MNSFENWKEEYGLQSEPNYSEHTEKDCKSAFKAGQQSQQAKIDDSENTRAVLYRENMDLREKNIDLQTKINELNEVVNGWKDEYRIITLRYERSKKQIDELQARVDKVVHILTYTNHASTPLCNELRDILKGNKDES